MADKRLLILWTTDNRQTAEYMVCMYGLNAKLQGWWDEVVLLTWGSSNQLVATDTLIQSRLAEMKDAGVRLIACRKCAEELGLVADLEELGIEVFYAGEFLTQWLQSGSRVLSV